MLLRKKKCSRVGVYKPRLYPGGTRNLRDSNGVSWFALELKVFPQFWKSIYDNPCTHSAPDAPPPPPPHTHTPHPKLTAQGPFAKPVSQVCDSIFPSQTNLVNAVLYSNEQGGQLNKMDVDWIDFHYKKQKKTKHKLHLSTVFTTRYLY